MFKLVWFTATKGIRLDCSPNTTLSSNSFKSVLCITKITLRDKVLTIRGSDQTRHVTITSSVTTTMLSGSQKWNVGHSFSHAEEKPRCACTVQKLCQVKYDLRSQCILWFLDIWVEHVWLPSSLSQDTISYHKSQSRSTKHLEPRLEIPQHFTTL